MTKTVLTYGTFDLFHIGHLNVLKRLRALGDRQVLRLVLPSMPPSTTARVTCVARFGWAVR